MHLLRKIMLCMQFAAVMIERSTDCMCCRQICLVCWPDAVQQMGQASKSLQIWCNAIYHYLLHCIISVIASACAYMACLTTFCLADWFCLATGGADMAGADRDDLEQLERAVRGRLLEVQILKLSAQCRASQTQFDAYLDVANTTARPKVTPSCYCA